MAVSAIAQPVSNFSATPLEGCNPLKVDFINSSTGAVSYLWKFGNGNESTLKDPGAVYNNPGKYTVTLIATNSSGKSDTIVYKNLITVFKSPVAQYYARDKQVCEGDSMIFRDSTIKGDGEIISWNWDFGDGGTSTKQSPAYKYTLAGRYDVTFAVKDTNGCESSVKGTKYAQVTKPPRTDFSSDLTNKCKVPLTVVFKDTTTGNSPFTYIWDFGDGYSGIGKMPSHTYNSTGNYTIRLKVTDAYGCSDSVKKSSLIKISPPKADFTANPTSLCLGDKTTFNNLCTPLDGTGAFSWDFGNGVSSTQQSPEIVYTATGTYTVKLKYTWDGCSDSLERKAYIKVNELPTGTISPRDQIVCRSSGDSILFKFSGKNIGSASWEVNNAFKGNWSVGAGFKFPINSNGSYVIVGYPFSPFGCKGKPDTVRVKVRGPIAGIMVDSAAGCIPFNVHAKYIGSGDAPIISYSWKGLGKTGSGTEMDFVKNTFGKTPIKITVVDSNGCVDSSSKIIDGGLRIEPVFETIKKICRNQPFWIYNNTSIKNEDTVFFKYSWDNKDTINFLPKDSIRVKLKDTPDQIIKYTFISISHGCTTGLDTSKLLKVKILGPKLEAVVQFECDKDSFIGINKSTHYTRSFWRYLYPGVVKNIDSSKYLKRKISETNDLWIFAYNDTNNCRDSLPYSLKVDPITASFTQTFDCATGNFKTVNKYPGLQDANFSWEVLNTSTGNLSKYQVRNLNITLQTEGTYEITLKVNNPAFTCTLPGTAKQVVFAKPASKPSVTVDRTSCYPVKFSLKDAAYDQWINPVWIIDGKTIKDSAKIITLPYTGNSGSVFIYHSRTDANGCLYKDTFKFNINGIKADINFSQTGGKCEPTVVAFTPSVTNGNGTLSYYWDFGYKQSTKKQDTVKVVGLKTLFVSLLVKDQFGCESQAYKTVKVNNGRPIAFFKVNDTTIACPPLNVEFTDSSIAGNNPIVKRLWNFGDSTFSDKLNPGKLYIYPGKYSVSLIVTNNIGCSDTFLIPELVVVKGPFGSYKFDKEFGCTPLDVSLTTNIKGQIKKLEFDMGDGAVLNAGSNAHLYTRPGLYIPRLIVVDSNGCKFSPQPTDTIRVYPIPKANFDNPPICVGENKTFTDNSSIDGDVISQYLWKLNGDSVGNRNFVQAAFPKGKRDHLLFLKVTSSNGCADSLEKPLRVFSITPLLISDKSEYCLGEQAFIEHTTISDTTIAVRSLWLDGKLAPDIDKVPVITTTRGKIPAILIVTDVVGCKDTLKQDVFLKVGDTLPPPPLTIYRTSVVDNFSTETKFNASIQPDFKKYNLYVWLGNSWQLKATTEDVNDTNLLAYGLNTLGLSYCHKITEVNYCGMETDSVLVVPHCSVEIKARGDTNLSRVWWNPYSGWNEVNRYRIYRKKTDETQFVLLDSVDGQTTVYIDTAIYCHVEYDYKVQAVEHNGFNELSWSDTARSKPTHGLPVPAPEVWRTTVNDNFYTHTEWITPKPHKYPYDHYSLWKNDGSGWQLINKRVSPDIYEHNDYGTNVQNTSYAYRLTATDVCDVTSPLSNIGKSVVLSVRPFGNDGDARLSWSEYQEWHEGVDQYVVERSIAGSPFAEIGRVDGDQFSFIDQEIPKYCVKDFVYRVTAVRNQPVQKDSSFDVRSVSNYDDFVPEIRFFIPNAFTPNANNLNEGFRPDGVFWYRYEMRIYNRYGQKVYEGDECLNAWDGNYNGKEAPDGVYAYSIQVWDYKGERYDFAGTLHLLR